MPLSAHLRHGIGDKTFELRDYHLDVLRAAIRVAKRFATLDHLSGGRFGWNIVTSWKQAASKAVSSHPDYNLGESHSTSTLGGAAIY